MGDVISLFTNSSQKTQSNNFRVNSKTDFKNKTSISDFRNRGANRIKFNGQELKAKEIRDVVGNIISGGHQTAKQIMRQLKDKYRVEIDDRRKIMRAVTSKYAGGANDNRMDTAKQMSHVKNTINKAGISSQTAEEIKDRIKHERDATGRSKIAENIEDFVEKMKHNINYRRSSEVTLPSAAFALKQNRSGKEASLKGALEANGVKTNLENIGAKRQEGIVSIHQYQQNKHYKKATSALSGEETATPVAGKVIPVSFRKGGDTASAVLKKAA